MSLPGDRMPEAVSGSHVDGQPPAQAEVASVWDRLGVEWEWVPAKGQFVCADPEYPGPGVTEPGAIPRDRQPFYAHPPSETQLLAAEIFPEEP